MRRNAPEGAMRRLALALPLLLAACAGTASGPRVFHRPVTALLAGTPSPDEYHLEPLAVTVPYVPPPGRTAPPAPEKKQVVLTPAMKRDLRLWMLSAQVRGDFGGRTIAVDPGAPMARNKLGDPW
jgi:hypothetical protein